MAKEQNVKLNEGFTQVCVWPGVMVVNGGVDPERFVALMQERLGVRVQYLEEILTKPDRFEDGSAVPGTGSRNDLFFALHNDDVMKFAIPRLEYGIRWLEDAIARINGGNTLYPPRVKKYVK
jgi:hypothetical protein